MGWADCGKDPKGRPIGYAFEATCDYPDCTAAIDRGLAYACGGMHGEDENSCEGYFCLQHLITVKIDGKHIGICEECKQALEQEE